MISFFCFLQNQFAGLIAWICNKRNFILEYFDCVPLFPLDVFINGEDKQEGKEDPGGPEEMPDIVTIEKVQ